jgi:hypothetical protein
MANDVWDIKNDLVVEYQAGSPATWYSVQATVYQVDIDRGISVEQGVFARPDVGNMTVRMVKSDLTDLVSGPAYKANMPIRIKYRPAPDTSPSTYFTIFYGFISNVSMNYNVESRKLDITIQADDTTKILTNTRLGSYSVTGTLSNRSFRNVMNNLATAIAAADSRISLSQLGSAASSTYQRSTTFVEAISGDILNQFLDAELGWCFSQRSGANQWYLTRLDIDALQATAWSSGNKTVSNVHSTSTNHYCMDYIDLSFDTDGLVNNLKVTETVSTPSSDTVGLNSTSVTNYGTWTADFNVDMEPGSSPTWTYMANWADAVATAADPKRIRRVSCPALRRDGKISSVADLEIANALQVEFVDPNNSSNKIQQVALITRINHSITAEHWEVTLDLWKGI